MKKILFVLLSSVMHLSLSAQTLYFPPLIGNSWETVAPASLGWCDNRIEAMYDMLEANNTKAFIVLKDGKIVLEKYFGTFQQDSVWYWASAGKTLTATLVGIAQQEGFLSIMDTTSDYLGIGWTSCAPAQEEKITIRHQLTMTSGLEDQVEDPYCTIDTCLMYKSDAGTRWAYHNGPYTLLDGVIESATGQNLNTYFQQKIIGTTGITGIFLPVGYNTIFFSKARSMARFGLMILNQGIWNGTPVLADSDYFNQMVNTSQDLNLSYGYLWWLNGKSSFMLPGLQFIFPGSLMPNAPDDMISALGKNGQIVNVVPSSNMVMIRMGNAPDNSEVSVILNDQIWQHINELECGTATTEDEHPFYTPVVISPNPAKSSFMVHFPGRFFDLEIYDLQGRIVFQAEGCFDRKEIHHSFSSGLYAVKLVTADQKFRWSRLVVE